MSAARIERDVSPDAAARIKWALATYKDAQRRKQLTLEAWESADTPSGADVPATLRAQAAAIRQRLDFELAAADVFTAAAELIDALEAAGYGYDDGLS